MESTSTEKVIQLTLNKTESALMTFLLGAHLAAREELSIQFINMTMRANKIPESNEVTQGIIDKLVKLSSAAWTDEERAVFEGGLPEIVLALEVDGSIDDCKAAGHHCLCASDECCWCGKSKLLNPI